MKILDFNKLGRSFKAAGEGLIAAFHEQTFRIFCFCALTVVLLMFVFRLSLREKIIVVFLVTLNLTLELINSQIEKILDIVQPAFDQRVKLIKDISAAAVLLASLGAAIIGTLIFLPYFSRLLNFFCLGV